MEPLALTGNLRIAIAIIAGIGFGVLLEKSDLIWRKTTLNALRLKDGRLLTTFLFSIFVGVMLFQLLLQQGLVNIQVRPAAFWPSLIGGIICGIGLIICAKVPISAIASFATGRIHALWVIIGMILAYSAVNAVSGFLSDTLYTWSKPIPYHEQAGDYFSFANPALWLSIISLVLVLFIQFTIGRGDND
jgi:Sulphur transport